MKIPAEHILVITKHVPEVFAKTMPFVRTITYHTKRNDHKELSSLRNVKTCPVLHTNRYSISVNPKSYSPREFVSDRTTQVECRKFASAN